MAENVTKDITSDIEHEERLKKRKKEWRLSRVISRETDSEDNDSEYTKDLEEDDIDRHISPTDEYIESTVSSLDQIYQEGQTSLRYGKIALDFRPPHLLLTNYNTSIINLSESNEGNDSEWAMLKEESEKSSKAKNLQVLLHEKNGDDDSKAIGFFFRLLKETQDERIKSDSLNCNDDDDDSVCTDKNENNASNEDVINESHRINNNKKNNTNNSDKEDNEDDEGKEAKIDLTAGIEDDDDDDKKAETGFSDLDKSHRDSVEDDLIFEIQSLFSRITKQRKKNELILGKTTQKLIEIDDIDHCLKKALLKLSIYEEVVGGKFSEEFAEEMLNKDCEYLSSPVSEEQFDEWVSIHPLKKVCHWLRNEVIELRSLVKRDINTEDELNLKMERQQFLLVEQRKKLQSIMLKNEEFSKLQGIDINKYIEIRNDRDAFQEQLEKQTRQLVELRTTVDDYQERYAICNNMLVKTQIEMAQLQLKNQNYTTF